MRMLLLLMRVCGRREGRSRRQKRVLRGQLELKRQIERVVRRTRAVVLHAQSTSDTDERASVSESCRLSVQ